jgi:malonyl-CoA O-methyltransferase
MNDTMDNDEFRIDTASVARAFDRAAADYDAHTPLQSVVRNNLLEKLELVTLQPEAILDAGCGTGRALKPLAKQFRKAELLALDIAPGMLQQAKRHKPWFRKLELLQGELESMPLADYRVDMIFSSLAMQWVNDLDRTLQECRRVLRGGGLFVFSSFGPDTLKELRSAFSDVDGFNHVNRFLDLHDVGDALVRAGFVEVVMDVEHFTLTYDTVTDLMRDLKRIGAHNVTAGRNHGLTGRQRLAALADAYEPFRREGKLPATYEVVYGTAWLPKLPQGVRYLDERNESGAATPKTVAPGN